MPTYTVHEPPPRKSESVTAPERFVFVRDGFHFWAFLLPPVWLLVRRLWLAFFIYVVITIAVAVGIKFAGLPSYVQSAAALVIALIIGFAVWLAAFSLQLADLGTARFDARRLARGKATSVRMIREMLAQKDVQAD